MSIQEIPEKDLHGVKRILWELWEKQYQKYKVNYDELEKIQLDMIAETLDAVDKRIMNIKTWEQINKIESKYFNNYN